MTSPCRSDLQEPVDVGRKDVEVVSLTADPDECAGVPLLCLPTADDLQGSADAEDPCGVRGIRIRSRPAGVGFPILDLVGKEGLA